MVSGSGMSRMLFIALVTCFVVASEVLNACPACKDSFGANGANKAVGDAYSYSIMFMLGVPITILTVFIVIIAKKIRQNPNSAPTM